MPRQAKLDAPGTLHHVIVRGIEKRPAQRGIDDRTNRDNFVSRLGQIASETETVIYAWVLMTNTPIFFCVVGHMAYQSACSAFLSVMQLPITDVITATVIFSRTVINR